MASLELIKSNFEDGYLVRLVPPQTLDIDVGVGGGAYCFVIDVSGSMNKSASVTNNDGDCVDHGWSQLDIAKHSTNTFVASLDDADWLSIVTYSDNAEVLVEWTRCDEAGREAATEKIMSMRPTRSTNLMAGLTAAFAQFELLPPPDEQLPQLALNMIVTTDGMPSAQWHPARGPTGYQPLVKSLGAALAKNRGAAATPVITSIGIGFDLDSALLLSFSDTFLHMPDPGQIGPFIVNCLASVRCTARLPNAQGAAATNVSLLISPASALPPASPAFDCVPGYRFLAAPATGPGGEAAVRVPLGALMYDQPRHVLLRTMPGAPALTVTLELHGAPVLTTSSADARPASEADGGLLLSQDLRLEALSVLASTLELASTWPRRGDGRLAVEHFLERLRASAGAALPAVAALGDTLQAEVLLGCTDANFGRWGAHYLRTLSCMLRAERRSNFRDACLQHFGRDAAGREALFEVQSAAAELRFATLAPPPPSLLEVVSDSSTAAGAYRGHSGNDGGAARQASPPRAMPDEFMRGGGCFGPDGRVGVAAADGVRVVRVADVRAGDRVLAADGQLATVRCVVMTRIDGGRALLTRLPNGLELTSWHPVRQPDGRWRFPIMLGTSVLAPTPYVYNFVLEPGHPALLVSGVPCAALGHGLQLPTVAHPYWGTRAVLDDLATKPGWATGTVVLAAAPATADEIASLTTPAWAEAGRPPILGAA